eukprot:m.142676 g.142676  ORF g.142676 m.142676 type:complete len:312 (-) comp14066_c1_seq4:1161-2096(-)
MLPGSSILVTSCKTQHVFDPQHCLLRSLSTPLYSLSFITISFKVVADQPKLISGEWGWSTCVDKSGTPITCIGGAFTGNNTLNDQAKFLARQWLINALAGIPISIFYDLFDDGTNTSLGENNFGTMYNQYNNESVPHVPKPSFVAAATLQRYLGDFEFSGRLNATSTTSSKCSPSHKPDGVVDEYSYVLQFGSDRFAVWKTNGTLGCMAGDRFKVDCGFFGITQGQCEARGCCFELPYRSGPQCSFKRPLETKGTVTFTLPSTLHSATGTAPCFDIITFLGHSVGRVCATANGSVCLPSSDEPNLLVTTRS